MEMIGKGFSLPKDQYDRIYEGLKSLIPDLVELKPGDYRKSVSGGFMDLHLDVLSREKEEMRIALAHNFIQNGDVVADPDMEIRVYLIKDWEKAEALTYQDQFGFRRVYPEPGYVNVAAKKELNAFLLQWLKNLTAQGHGFHH